MLSREIALYDSCLNRVHLITSPPLHLLTYYTSTSLGHTLLFSSHVSHLFQIPLDLFFSFLLFTAPSNLGSPVIFLKVLFAPVSRMQIKTSNTISSYTCIHTGT